MGKIQISLFVASAATLVFAGFNNFAPVEQLTAKAKSDVKHLTGEVKQIAGIVPVEEDVMPEKEYVQIDGKLYEKNPHDVYYINGVPTLVKKAKKVEAPKTVAKNPNLGPPINEKIFKDAMGLDESDEFFKPKTEASE